MPQAQKKRCLVLGCGGVTGLAWEIGILAGLERHDVDLCCADLFIGCSAGSVAGAQLALGVPPMQLLATQLCGTGAEQYRPYSQQAADDKNRELYGKVGADLGQARRRIGAYARRSATPTLAERRAIIASRLGASNWPSRPLLVVAVDTATGEGRSFSAADQVDFIDAIAASCAVPGAWPAVPIGGATYMDGGIRSMTNADMAAGYQQVVVLAPLGYREGNPVSGHLRRELQTLCEAGSLVHAVLPDAASVQAIGDNVLDPARRADAAEAGLRQASAIAQALRQAWR
ncbi:patatin-like phospholipase family protein [Achromobacter xylosoxidans]|uniref:Patatin-like phospholipase family protein n=1 Tax=Alcaligenes xylosoxydans xylosoxydans TaxID=85698 RepID=A0A424WJY2_ALCXX|nr:patatin-like phospholipase family protein [Achromobacter xylosoxidans]MBC9904054.1 patatin-like phospholipase family protein [Achromobacter xylosoxidans]MBD0867987.1 patatin-like phospholipase family protein [Achromobacter xylosoxidans]QNP86645.1 patatin-like phospholipase family protein [Achromobacter xylosoxidans]RPJ93590.1 patatin-like phospholipase family protein [Achromobacter xylosoxidans]